MKKPRPVELFLRVFLVRCEECSTTTEQRAMQAMSATLYECATCKQTYTLTPEDMALKERNMTFLGADKRKVHYQ